MQPMKNLLVGEKLIQKSGFNFIRNYPAFPLCHLQDGRICGSLTLSKEHIVNLFEYYEHPMPRKIITAIFGETAPDKLNPYTLFASIDSNNPQQVVQWFTHFGAPDGNVRFDAQAECYYPLDVFAKHVKEMNNVLTVIEALQSGAKSIDAIMTDIVKQYNGYIPGSICGYKEITEGVSDQIKDLFSKVNIFDLSPSYLGREYVDALFQHYLSDICPCIMWRDKANGNQPSLAWTSGPMISQLYFMLALDITAGKMPRKCMNDKCHRYFTPARSSTRYCSDICKERAKQHRHYKKLKNEQACE
ncbi:Hypothetical protein LUCI_3852 [Lucifera butyrica]|uniref:Uncharacterized protein n=2 Tax=Lucifera butyrica TaxID=1351585 RepID=A0A498RAR7_9FIRM|nr:Hypothetical protein LUCI_3852 [Lucifera butyrica]